jgi:hypothetical protein
MCVPPSQEEEIKMSDYLNVDYFVSPNSSWVNAVAYDEEEKITYVRTQNNSIYAYTDTEYADFVALAYADSVGHEYQDFASDFGPSTHVGSIDMYLRVPREEPAVDPISEALTEWEKDLLAENEEALEAEIAVDTRAEIDPIWEKKALRREALSYAVDLHKTAYASLSPGDVLDTAISFEEYLNADS